jgi:hypothetical protein
MKYFFRSFLFLLFLVLFNLKSFALEISEIDSTTGHNWFKILNNLADIINGMLVENKSNGLTLDASSVILLKNVDTLNKNSIKPLLH